VRLTKIERMSTHCRCRLIWVSNPRPQRPLNTYNFGIEAVKELIGAPEDVRRFDIACAVASGEVPDRVVNAARGGAAQITHRYTSELCRDLLLWVWSRRPERVHFEPDALEAISAASQRLGAKYVSSIPLVEPAAVENAIRGTQYPADAVRALLESGTSISADDVQNWTGMQRDEAQQFLGYLVRKRALRRERFGYAKAPAFTTLLKQMQSSELGLPAAPPHAWAKSDRRGAAAVSVIVMND